MQTHFVNRELRTLYETGRSRKYKLQPQVVRKFTAAVDFIKEAEAITDFWRKPGMNYEQLSNTDIHSIRIDHRYRIEFTMDWTNEARTVGIVGITELSNHYGG